ncbi:MAG: hypothetical protein M1825_000942 [Sarcosagium campestre]|nr:MAG: hypothetical protein M1825_000942 [Sarcosagium campestre]
METVDTTVRLAQLRKLMNDHDVAIYIVPSEDSHQSEYIAPCDGRREFISGFSGSAGTAIVTLEKAALATDGRYFNQAEKQLDSNWTLLKQGLQDVPTWQEWTVDQAEGGRNVGVDPTLITAPDARKLAEKIKNKGGGTLRDIDLNLVDVVWGASRPSRPQERIKPLALEFAGKKFGDKLEDLRKELEKKKSPGIVVCMLDEIAWLYNLRGNDIPYNPVFFSYAVVTASAATLYVDSTKLSDDVKQHLGDSVALRPYEAIFEDTKELGKALASDVDMADVEIPTSLKTKFLVSTRTSWALSKALGGEDHVEEVRSIIGDAKAVKNDTELSGMRACHIRDGAALISFFAWLEHELVSKEARINEVEAAEKLQKIRSYVRSRTYLLADFDGDDREGQHYVGLSFDTISSTGANAAVIHYKPEKDNCSMIDPKAVYLCDSGAQYFDGTTDTTRTLHFGEPTEMERKAYTLVLKGHIALDRAIFPKGTSGFALDTLARQFLWEEGLDYRHGTGHGVGSYLNVHEGPIGVGTRIQYSEVPLAAGNVLSNEPGYYEDGLFGIRTENMVIVKEVKTNHNFGEKPYLGFEHVTMVPMCRRLIDEKILSSIEKKWLNRYHAEIFQKTKGYFEDGSQAMNWLKRETQPI